MGEADAKKHGSGVGRRPRAARRIASAIAVLALLVGAQAAGSEGRRGVVTLAANDELVRQLELEQGKALLLQPRYDVRRVSVGDPDVADVVVVSNRELQLVAKRTGETNVVLWDGAGHAQAAIDLVVARPHAGIERELRRVSGNDDVQIERVGESIVLKGTVPDATAMERALRVAHAFFPKKRDANNIVNLLEVGGNHQVMIEVTIAEMSRTLTRNMETDVAALVQRSNSQFRVLGLLSGLLTPGGAVAVPTGRANLFADYQNLGETSAAAALNFLQERGLVKVLAEPTLLARSGQSASFLAGGEVPIPIAQGGAFGSITIEFKRFGVLVDFTPTVLGDDRIHMEISPEVSEPDFTLGTAVDGTTVPGFRTRRAATGVELGDGESFAIAGLLSENVRETAGQYPLLGDIPVLGTLFRSKQYQKNESELVLIVRPRLVKPLPEGRPPLPTDHFVEPSGYEFYLTPALEGRRPEPELAGRAGVAGGLLGAAGHRISIRQAEKEL